MRNRSKTGRGTPATPPANRPTTTEATQSNKAPAETTSCALPDDPTTNPEVLLTLARELDESRRHVEQARREWTQALDAIDEPVFVHDLDYRIVRANRAYAKRAGKPIRDILGLPYWKVFPLHDGPLDGCLNSRETVTPGQEEIRLESGEIFDSYTYPISDEDGRYRLALHVMRDVTEKRRSESTLRSFSLALEQAGEGIVILTPEFTISYANSTFCKLLDKNLSELVQHNITALNPEAAHDRATQIQGALAVNERWSGELELQTEAGAVIPVYLNARAFRDGDDAISGYVCSYLDLRPIKAATDKIETLSSAIEDLSLELDVNTLIHKALAATRKVCGVEVGALALVDEDSGQLYYRWFSGAVFEKRHKAIGGPFPADKGLAGEVVRTGKTKIIADYAQYESALPSFKKLGLRSALATPVHVDGSQVKGVLSVGSLKTPYTFTTEQVRFIEAMARQVGVAIQRQRLADEIRNSAARLQHIVETVPDILFVLQVPELNPIFVSSTVTELLGFTPEEAIADPNLWRRQLHMDDQARILDEISRVIDDGEGFLLEARFWHKDGETLRWFEARGIIERNAEGAPAKIVGALTDISLRKQSEIALEQERGFVSAVLDTADALVVVMDPTGRVVRWNQACEKLTGYRFQEVQGKHMWDFLTPDEEIPTVESAYQTLSDNQIPSSFESHWLTKNGECRLVAWSNTTLAQDGELLSYIIATGVDITERKQAEEGLHKVNRALQTLSQCNQILIRASDEPSLLHDICDAIVQQGGYRLAWVGYAENNPRKSITPMATAGHDAGYLDQLRLTWAKTKRGLGPSGSAIRSGEPVLSQNIASDPHFSPWRKEALARGYGSAIALPLHTSQGIIGALHIYSAEAYAFNAEEINLLVYLANDLAYGIGALRDRTQREQMEVLQRETLVDTIKAIALTLEKRDPYTAGHQERVSRLFTFIAEELQLDDQRIEGLRLAAMIHDIGKIYVPAEILNRPGRLSAAEFEIIKSHALVGYDIVQNIRFPWPVAEMILQHHERLDGSGYPQGLKGDQILLEAQIIAVADVVEAMAYHRPYRPGLGSAAALDEITSNKGRLYAPKVVDACVQVLKTHSDADWQEPPPPTDLRLI